MAIVSVNLVDTFDEWRIKTNSLGTETGDLTGLSTSNKASIVAAINEVDTNADLGLKNIVEDTTPELGGPLNFGTHNITGSGVSQSIILSGESSSITLSGVSSTITAGRFSGAIELSDDSQPELAANLNLSGFDITGTGNINITGGVTATGAVAGASVTATGAVAGATLSGAWSGSLNGDLGLNSNNITGTGNINITGSLTATSIAGTVVGVTQSASDNSTKIATTAYVDAQVATENTLVEMDDTVITTPTNGQTLTYNGTEWVNSTPAAGGGGISLALAIAVG
jgi:hypothetical protein